MEKKYRVSYTESEKILTTICEVYDIDNSDIMLKFVAAVLGVLVLIMMFIYGNPGGGTTSGIAMFLIKYIASFIAIFIAAMIFNRKIWRGAVKASALAGGQENFAERMKKRKNPLKVKMDFYDDHFTNITPNKQKEYPYELVTKLIETEDGFGIKYKTDASQTFVPNGMMGFPKNTLEDADFDEFKNFLLERCPNVKKIKKL